MNLTIVPFHGDQLLASKDERGVWVPIKRVCEALGVAEEPQRRKLHGKAWATTTMWLRQKELLESDLQIVHALAVTSRNPAEFRARLHWHFNRRPFQLGLSA